MNQVQRIACGVPFCQSAQEKQTNLSVLLRVTAVALGTIVAIVGILILLGVPGLSQLGTTVGWTMFSIGALSMLIGTSIKCVRKESQTAEIEDQTIIHESAHNLSSTSSEARNTQIITTKTPHKKSEGPLLRLNDPELFTTTWYQRQQKNGYQCGDCLNLAESKLELIKSLSAVRISDIKQINMFPLYYRLQEEENRIFIDLDSHIEVINSNISSLKIKGKQFYTKLESSSPLLNKLIRKKESFEFNSSAGWSHFITQEMPGVLFFTADNGLPDIERNLLRINSEQFMCAIHIFFGLMAESKIEFAFEEV